MSENQIKEQFPAAASTEVYYGTITGGNEKILHLVKVIKGNLLETRMIEVLFWKSFLEEEDYFNAVISIKHSTMGYYTKDVLEPNCDEILFEKMYSIALNQFKYS
jgi:hypothetical protein